MIELFLKMLSATILVSYVWTREKRVRELEQELRLNIDAMENAIEIEKATLFLLTTLKNEGKGEIPAVRSLVKVLLKDLPRSGSGGSNV